MQQLEAQKTQLEASLEQERQRAAAAPPPAQDVDMGAGQGPVASSRRRTGQVQPLALLTNQQKVQRGVDMLDDPRGTLEEVVHAIQAAKQLSKNASVESKKNWQNLIGLLQRLATYKRNALVGNIAEPFTSNNLWSLPTSWCIRQMVEIF